MRGLWGFLVCYAAALLLLAPVPALSLDEILTLVGAVQPDLDSLLKYVETVAGGTPLAFLLPKASMAWLGQHPLAARLPSLLASIAACPAVFLLARRTGVRTPLLAVAVFALWPLQLRYALEARPYTFALACSVWSTEILLSQRRTVLYVVLTVLAALAQPYALFVPVAHLVYKRRIPALGLAASALVLTPWFLHYRPVWNRVMGDQRLAGLDWRSPLVFVHEIAGSGYAGAALVALGAALGLRKLHSDRRFWVACAAIPLAAVFVANNVFHYFFAVRQTIFILPALALLFALGGNRVLTAAFLAMSLYMDVAWFRRPREDWQAAANAVQRQLARGGCVQFLGDSTPVYLYFHPEMGRQRCSGPSDRVILAISPYYEDADYPPAVAAARASGLALRQTLSFNGPRVEVFSR